MGINTFSFYQHQRIGKRVPVAAGQRQQRLEQRWGRILTPPHTPGTARGGHSPGTGAARHPSARRFCKDTAPSGQNHLGSATVVATSNGFGVQLGAVGSPSLTPSLCPWGGGTARQRPGCHPARSTSPGCLAKARCKRTKDEVSVCVPRNFSPCA